MCASSGRSPFRRQPFSSSRFQSRRTSCSSFAFRCERVRAQRERSQLRHAEMNVLAASLTAGLAEMPGKNHVEDDAAEAGNRALGNTRSALVCHCLCFWQPRWLTTGGHTGPRAGREKRMTFRLLRQLRGALCSCQVVSAAGGDAGNAGTRRHRPFPSCSAGRVSHGASVASSEKSIHGAGYSSEWSFRCPFA